MPLARSNCALGYPLSYLVTNTNASSPSIAPLLKRKPRPRRRRSSVKRSSRHRSCPSVHSSRPLFITLTDVLIGSAAAEKAEAEAKAKKEAAAKAYVAHFEEKARKGAAAAKKA